MSTALHRLVRFVGLIPARHGRPYAPPAPVVDPDATQEFRIAREGWEARRHPYGGAS